MSVNLEHLPEAVRALVRIGAKRVILFGSAATDPQQAGDVDLAVEGIPRNTWTPIGPMDIYSSRSIW